MRWRGEWRATEGMERGGARRWRGRGCVRERRRADFRCVEVGGADGLDGKRCGMGRELIQSVIGIAREAAARWKRATEACE